MSRANTYAMPGGRVTIRLTMLTIAACFVVSGYSYSEDAATRVQLDSTKAGPRVVESLTERGIARDYRLAWDSMAHALAFNVADPLEGRFTGDAKQWLLETVNSQQRSGSSQRYREQNHKVEAVFYAPEGDVIELHDTAEFQQQIVDGKKVVQDERVVVHYVVLMTPSADHWVVRQLQAVPQF